MKLENLTLIESKYNFIYPKIYKTLLQDNMLDWGSIDDDWIHKQYPTLKNKPPLLLYGVDFEIISHEEIIEEINYFSDEDNINQPKEEFNNKFIPFGKTTGGELYCFYLDDNNEVKNIIVIWDNENSVEIVANSLEDFIFRNLLACVIDPDINHLIMNGNFKENIKNQLLTHKKYLTLKQLNVIEDVYSKDSSTLLDNTEYNNILEQMNIVILNSSFEYQRDYGLNKDNSITVTPKKTIVIDLKEFLLTGKFDCVKLGQKDEWIDENFMKPIYKWSDDMSGVIWSYGVIELFFNENSLDMIFCDGLNALRNIKNIKYKKWILQDISQLTISYMLHVLNTEQLDYKVTCNKTLESINVCIEKSNVELLFEETDETSNPNEYKMVAFWLKT